MTEIDKFQKGDTVDPEPIAVLRRQLDEAYWSEQELVESGESYEMPFSTGSARPGATNALLFALTEDATYGCTEAVYQAFHAYSDEQVMLDRLRTELA